MSRVQFKDITELKKYLTATHQAPQRSAKHRVVSPRSGNPDPPSSATNVMRSFEATEQTSANGLLLGELSQQQLPLTRKMPTELHGHKRTTT